MPFTGDESIASREKKRPQAVMVVTDHLTGDHRLVNTGVKYTEPSGILHLTHVEDEKWFRHYMSVIKKIPAIESETARDRIGQQLLKEPRDYIESARSVLEEQGLNLRIAEVVVMGDELSMYRDIVESKEIDLIVLNTKDENQRAMNGLAYGMAVELRHVPMLML